MGREVEVFHKGQLYIGAIDGNTVWYICKWCIVDECKLVMSEQEYMEVSEIFAEMGYALD